MTVRLAKSQRSPKVIKSVCSSGDRIHADSEPLLRKDSALHGRPSGPCFKSLDHLDQPIGKAFPIMRCLDGATGQFSDPCHLLAQHLAPQWPGRHAGDGLNGAQQVQQDGDIAHRAAADLIE